MIEKNQHHIQDPLKVQHYESFEDFYRDIPLEGSLGILAYGAKGVLAWKRKRQEAGWVPPVPVHESRRRKSKTAGHTNE
jgi:hypothetical protein